MKNICLFFSAFVREDKGAAGGTPSGRMSLFAVLITCLIGFAVLPSARAGLVGYWDFNDNTDDQSGNGLSGTIVGSPTYDTSVPAAVGGGKSIHFDGTNDWVDLGKPPSLDFATEGFTFGGWIKTTQVKGSGDDGKGTLFSNGGDRAGGIRYTLTYNETTASYVTLVFDDNVTKYTVENMPTLLNDGVWHHVVGVRDGTQQRIYIDGQPEGTNSTLSATYNLSGTSQLGALIGAAYSAADAPPDDIIKKLEGNVDDVFVWRGVLSDQEIAQLASGAATPLSLAASAPPSVSNLMPANNAIGYPATSDLSFTVSGPRTISTVTLILNGQDVTGSLSITGATTNKNVAFSGLQGNQFYTGQIIASDTSGASITNDITFDTLGSGGVLIENEDYNYGVDGSGQPVIGICASGDTGPTAASGGGFQDDPPASGFTTNFTQVNGNGIGYLDTIAVSGVDYSDTSTTVADASINSYRTCTPVGVHTTGDYRRLKYTTQGMPEFDLELQNMQPGEWLNYTRTFPNDNYIAYLRVRATAAQKLELSRVTSNPAQGSQTTSVLGVFNVPVTSGYMYVPLADLATGGPLVQNFSGVETLRLTALGANNDVFPNFIVFLASTNSTTVPGPFVSVQTPAPGATGVDVGTSIGATIENRTRSVVQNTVELSLNGKVVTPNITSTATGLQVSYQPASHLSFNASQTVQLIYQDNMADSYTNTWSFTTALPTVAITSPTAGQRFPTGTDVPITASPSEPASVQLVEFFADGLKIGESAAAPFSITLSDPLPGSFTLTAVADYGNSVRVTSPAVQVAVGPEPPMIITSVVETGGDNEATDTIVAQWTGQTFVNGVADEPITGSAASDSYTVGRFAEDAPMFVDRNHQWNGATTTVGLPDYLVGNEYIMSGNDDRDNADYRLDVTVSQDVRVYMLIDDRLPDGDNATPPQLGTNAMQWILDGGWQPVMNGLNRSGDPTLPDEVGADEGGDGVGPGQAINQWSSVYEHDFPAGTFSLFQADNAGRNMYGVVVAPVVTLPDVSITSPSNGDLFAPQDVTVTVDASSANGIAGVEFFQNDVKVGEDRTAPYELTLPNVAEGTYTLTARAVDVQGNRSTSDPVTFTVDNSPPALQFAWASVDSNNVVEVTLQFDEPLLDTTALTPANYSIMQAGTAITNIMAGRTNSVVLSVSGLSPNTAYTVSVSGISDTHGNDLTGSETATFMLPMVQINFQLASAPVPSGYLADGGTVYADQGNGYSYGWETDATDDTRDRDSANAFDQRYDTLCHLQRSGDNHTWEIALPNGSYDVHVATGDPDNSDQVSSLDIEGVIAEDTNGQADRMEEHVVHVDVTDGRLTIQAAPSGMNSKIMFLNIAPAAGGTTTIGPLSISYSGGNVTITWPGEGRLQESDTVDGTYTDVAGNPASGYTTQASEPQKFYRLAQ